MAAMLQNLIHRRGLLVSVRDAREAAIVEPFADVVDVKDPTRGPLGAASPKVWNSVLQTVNSKPVSLALGDADDWDDAVPPAISSQVAAVKLGPSLDGSHQKLIDTRRRFDEASGRQLPWVAVLYADRPHDRDVWIESAVEAGCVGLLVDTADKAGRRLPEIWSEAVFEALRHASSMASLPLVLAGRLYLEDVSNLAPFADLIGVRSAACASRNRQLGISSENARACREAIDLELAE